MGCPITTTKNFLENAWDFVFPGHAAAAIPAFKGMDAVTLIERVNSAMDIPHENAASTRRGNKPLEIYIGAPNKNTADLIFTETHGVLRATVGELGKLFDRKALPPATAEKMKQLDAQIDLYKKNTKMLQDMFKDEHAGLENLPIYDDLNWLDYWIMRGPKKEEACEKIAMCNDAVDALLPKLDWDLEALKYLPLKGETAKWPNHATNTPSQRSAHMFFYFSYMARAVLDTTKIPASLHEHYRHVLPTSGGGGAALMSDIVDHIKTTGLSECPSIARTFENAAEKLQERLALCGSFGNLQANDPKNLTVLAGINSRKIHAEILKRADSKKETAATANPTVTGKCPLNHGPQ